MTPGGRTAALAGIALVLGLLAVAWQSILRRSENYAYAPEYSSLNNETGGVKAYYEALARLGVPVRRNYEPFHKLEGTPATVFYIGPSLANFRYVSRKNLELFERVARSGSRVVIGLDPKFVRAVPDKDSQAGPERRGETAAPEKPLEDNLRQAWGVGTAQSQETPITKEMPNVLRSTFSISSWGAEWAPACLGPDGAVVTGGACGERILKEPGSLVAVERAFGRGSVTLMANADLLTNKALLAGPASGILAYLANGRAAAVFDESHLGVADTGSVAGLAAAHHLQWVALTFVLLAILYVWRNATSFVPPAPSRSAAIIPGHDAYAALSALLRRSVSPSRIMSVVAAEWNRSAHLDHRVRSAPFEAGELEALADVPASHVTAEYRRIARRFSGRSGG